MLVGGGGGGVDLRCLILVSWGGGLMVGKSVVSLG